MAQAWGDKVKERILAGFHGPITEHLTEEVTFYFFLALKKIDFFPISDEITSPLNFLSMQDKRRTESSHEMPAFSLKKKYDPNCS